MIDVAEAFRVAAMYGLHLTVQLILESDVAKGLIARGVVTIEKD